MITIQGLTDRMNYYRANPKALAAYIRKDFLGSGGVNCSTGLHATWRLNFSEKCGAINECINRLNSQPALGPFKIDIGLTKTAKEHSDYQISIGRMTHTGPAGRSGLGDRIKLNNKFASAIAENIIDAVKSHSPNADRIIAQWAIDNGVPGRGHYHNMFNAKYNTWGVGIKTWSNGTKERITTFHAATASCCTKTFSASQKSAMYWTGIRSSSINPSC
jgi:hypothetical protein